MNYELHYYRLILKRKFSPLYKTDNVYTENHHIRPLCFGGSNDESNLVRRIDPEELSSYLAQGWKPGYLHKNLTMRLRIRTGHPDKPHKLIEKSRSSTLPSATIFKDSSTAIPIALYAPD